MSGTVRSISDTPGDETDLVLALADHIDRLMGNADQGVVTM